MKIKENELALDGNRVLQKIYTGGEYNGVRHYNLEAIATFYFKKGNPAPEDMAKLFYDAIKGA